MKNYCFILALILSPTALAKDTDAHTKQLLDFARKAELANAEAASIEAQLKAKELKSKLNPPIVIPPEPAIEKLSKSNSPSALDTIRLKSLVTSNGVTTGWIAVDGELIEIKKGSRFGSISIVELTTNSILLSDGQRQKRLHVSATQPIAPPIKDDIYVH